MTAPAVPVEKVAATLGFTLEELALNRAGRLSPHQTWDAVKDALSTGGLVLAAAGVMLALVFVVRPTGWARLYYILGVGSLAIVSILGWQSIAGAVKRTVLAVEGPLDLHGTGRGVGAAIGGVSVPVPYQALDVLTKGAIYRMYCLDHARHFLSIEPVAGTSATHDATESGR